MKMKRSIALVVSLILVLTVAVGGTLAFLISTSGPVTNIFSPSNVNTSVEETIEGKVKKNVSIKNDGNISAYIRAAVVVTWRNEAGNVYGTAPVAGTDYTISFPSDTGWVNGDDGFYYYTNAVPAGQSTGFLISEAEYLANAPAGYSLCIEILGSGIQADPFASHSAAWEAWAANNS